MTLIPPTSMEVAKMANRRHESSMIKNLLLFDTETTGTDPKKDQLIEVACVLWSVQFACVRSCWSTVVKAEDNPAFHINKIPKEICQTPFAVPRDQAWATIAWYAQQADAIVAHNAEFDRQWVPELGKPWICSQEDICWPNVGEESGPGKKTLANIALSNDVGITHAHRALTDCVILSRVFERVAERGTDLQAMLTRALRPKALFKAIVDYEDREKAKKAGFHWEPQAKYWMRRMAIEDAKALPFRTVQVTA